MQRMRIAPGGGGVSMSTTDSMPGGAPGTRGGGLTARAGLGPRSGENTALPTCSAVSTAASMAPPIAAPTLRPSRAPLPSLGGLSMAGLRVDHPDVQRPYGV